MPTIVNAAPGAVTATAGLAETFFMDFLVTMVSFFSGCAPWENRIAAGKLNQATRTEYPLYRRIAVKKKSPASAGGKYREVISLNTLRSVFTASLKNLD